MSETDPGHSDQYAGDVGAHRATVGTPTERESINVPPTRPGAAENAREAAAAREEHETFIPETPIPDERSEAQESLRAEEQSLRGERSSKETGDERGGDRAETGRGRAEAGEGHEAAGAGHVTTVGGHGRRAGHDKEEADVRKDIQETREQLGETVSALARKADVKGRASSAVETAKGKAADAAEAMKGKTSEVAGKVGEHTPDRVKDAAQEARKRPVLFIAVLGAVVAFVVRRLLSRGRRRR
ncbi:MAG TPA: DUF3618 domain-containing protein [Nonomuraea sp.]|nr:DUF3618 domain-containing protein [Nonomuraea sp.]